MWAVRECGNIVSVSLSQSDTMRGPSPAKVDSNSEHLPNNTNPPLLSNTDNAQQLLHSNKEKRKNNGWSCASEEKQKRTQFKKKGRTTKLCDQEIQHSATCCC